MNTFLCARIRDAIARGAVWRVALAAALVRSRSAERACHANVAQWTGEHPEHRAVHGWLLAGVGIYTLHSVLDTVDDLLDITPQPGHDAQDLVASVVEPLPLAGLSLQLIDPLAEMEAP
ncbi:hypothetical protein LPN04_28955 [Rugamonas sp. A1-17]|nr:hypothetical protein [Rugamonas sp. A1-17]